MEKVNVRELELLANIRRDGVLILDEACSRYLPNPDLDLLCDHLDAEAASAEGLAWPLDEPDEITYERTARWQWASLRKSSEARNECIESLPQWLRPELLESPCICSQCRTSQLAE